MHVKGLYSDRENFRQLGPGELGHQAVQIPSVPASQRGLPIPDAGSGSPVIISGFRDMPRGARGGAGRYAP